MRIEINRQLCAGHARCNATAPDLFQLDEDGYIDTDGFEVPAGSEDDAALAADSCPERAIRVVS